MGYMTECSCSNISPPSLHSPRHYCSLRRSRQMRLRPYSLPARSSVEGSHICIACQRDRYNGVVLYVDGALVFFLFNLRYHSIVSCHRLPWLGKYRIHGGGPGHRHERSRKQTSPVGAIVLDTRLSDHEIYYLVVAPCGGTNENRPRKTFE